MIGKIQSVVQQMSMPQDVVLAKYCPDLATWPERWQFDEHDIAPGQNIVECFKPFLVHLIGQSLAAKTIKRHRDNLWLLGGELIRRRYEDAKLSKMPAHKAITELIMQDGGPLIWPRITEADQDSLNGTCRKLYKFLNSSQESAK